MPILSPRQAAEYARVSHLDRLTAAEAAVYYRVSRPTFEKMIRRLGIPFYRPAGPNGDRLFFKTDLDAGLDRIPREISGGGQQ